MSQISLNHRYTWYSTVGCILLLIFICWFLFVAAIPKEEPTLVTETPTIEKPQRYDPWSSTRTEARLSGIDSRLVIGIIKSENLLNRHKEIEGACLLSANQALCIQKLAETNKSLTKFLNRRPTPSDLLLAHSFGETEALRISTLTGSAKIDELGEEIIKANPNLKGYQSIRDFRIWLRRAVYRNMY